MNDDADRNERIRRLVHDLRSPLNTIIGFASLIRDGKAGPVTDKQREFLDDILSGAKELDVMITTTLTEQDPHGPEGDARAGV